MRPVVRDLWVKALRTGAYPQGRCQLRSPDDKFCPMGVLCDLAVMVGVTAWERLDGIWFIPPFEGGAAITPAIAEWAGFRGMHLSQPVPLTFGGVKHPIWRLNDKFKLSFDTIADLIEAQY